MSRQGWNPEIGPGLTLAEVVDEAFDYRGNTTIVGRDGAEIVGYVFNRNAAVPDPYLLYFDDAGEGPFTLRYAEVATIKFTGRDTAAGNSWKAWVERRERERAEAARAGRLISGPHSSGRDPDPDGR
jgi:hypothetical protein